MAAHQAPPSLGFFRQEHWSGYQGTLEKKKDTFLLENANHHQSLQKVIVVTKITVINMIMKKLLVV